MHYFQGPLIKIITKVLNIVCVFHISKTVNICVDSFSKTFPGVRKVIGKNILLTILRISFSFSGLINVSNVIHQFP